jgi:lysozyme
MMRDQLFKQIRHDEGEKLHVYKDHLGFWTIGVGILVDQRRGGGLTHFESAWLANNRLDMIQRELSDDYPWFDSLNDPRKAALINMRYQLGRAGLAAFKTTLACVRDERWAEAESHAMNSKWAKQDTPERAKRVAHQLSTGEWEYAV